MPGAFSCGLADPERSYVPGRRIWGPRMSDLWIYHRRPSSLTRYRHGGAAAFDPAVRALVAKVPSHGDAIVSGDDTNVLQFPLPAKTSRPRRSAKPRRRRPKPPGPKTRDN